MSARSLVFLTLLPLSLLSHWLIEFVQTYFKYDPSHFSLTFLGHHITEEERDDVEHRWRCHISMSQTSSRLENFSHDCLSLSFRIRLPERKSRYSLPSPTFPPRCVRCAAAVDGRLTCYACSCGGFEPNLGWVTS